MTIDELSAQIAQYKASGKTFFTTSSFQSHSLVMLHILNEIEPNIPVYFLNTGFHFPETLAFRDQITKLWNLNLKISSASKPRSLQKDIDGKFYYVSDPDYCCHINKVEPMDAILAEYDVWINGVRASQSAVRQGFKIEEKSKYGVVRFHPMLDWTSKMINDYLNKYEIPRHPLEDKGYFSIGCEPCTRKYDPNMTERESRWFGLNKTECGLNTTLVETKP